VNLNAVANRLTGGINPNVTATLRSSTGYATGAAYRQVPSYAAPVEIAVQMQALTKKEIEHLASMNISNAVASVYANRQLSGVDRTKGVGGDLLTIDGDLWLVVAVLEGWTGAGWCKAAIARQMPA